jgi:hypothetical protein
MKEPAIKHFRLDLFGNQDLHQNRRAHVQRRLL